jgi:hypothetical protein
MRLKSLTFFLFLFSFSYNSVFAQNHVSVPLENNVYNILEQMELKGISAPLSGIKPYTRNAIYNAIKEILNSEKVNLLGNTEIEILEQYLHDFSIPEKGLDLRRGIYSAQTFIGNNDTLISANIGAGADYEFSSGFYPSFNEYYIGNELWINFFMNGDLGDHASWEFGGSGGVMHVPRKYLGDYNTYYEGFKDDSSYQNQLIEVFSEPLTQFPYSFKKRWDGSVYYFTNLSGFANWPDPAAGGYNLLSEISASFLQNKLFMRIGRLSHEWGSVPFGSSLALNKMARPFLAFEAEFWPVSWFGFSTMTGILEYYNTKGIKKSSMSFQNAYSSTFMQFRYKNYLFLDLGEAVVWPKRFELGYISPLTNMFFYQNNIGDFDNMAIMLNMKLQYPGLGNIWLSFFIDEMDINKSFYELDRTMIAVQAGACIPLPFLSFSSIKISYTRINPYNYTHNRVYIPWYREDTPMEQSYINNGVNLGYYLPPNSDELLLSFETMPVKNLTAHFQYQLIRHGADFGSSAVDGSSMYSELDPDGRNGSNPVLRRFFLQDGAYQWMHIIKAELEWKAPSYPIALFLEAGMHISYFTNIASPANVTGQAYRYEKIDTAEYPKSTGFIMKMGIKIFPR